MLIVDVHRPFRFCNSMWDDSTVPKRSEGGAGITPPVSMTISMLSTSLYIVRSSQTLGSFFLERFRSLQFYSTERV